jgi:hypothetical protein
MKNTKDLDLQALDLDEHFGTVSVLDIVAGDEIFYGGKQGPDDSSPCHTVEYARHLAHSQRVLIRTDRGCYLFPESEHVNIGPHYT